MSELPASPPFHEPPNLAVTRILNKVAEGDDASAAQLLPLVYDQLRRAAQQHMQAERRDHTLTATALVHEAYLKLVGPRDIPWAGRGHLYAAAAQAMRRILIDHARARAASVGGHRTAGDAALAIAGLESISIDDNLDGLLALDDALTRLEVVDAQAAAVVRLRFFAGLSIEQAALALAVSERTVKRDWAFARGWLRQALDPADAS